MQREGDGYPRFAGRPVALLVLVMALLAALLDAREGGSGAQVLVGALFAAACVYSGARTLGPEMSLPVDRHRFRFVLAFTLILGGPVAAMGIPQAPEAGALDSLLVAAVVAVTLFGFIWSIVARPHRGPMGWFLGLRGGYRCPACGRPTPTRSGRCMYCDAHLP